MPDRGEQRDKTLIRGSGRAQQKKTGNLCSRPAEDVKRERKKREEKEGDEDM